MPLVEGEDEREQVQSQGQHPQERHGGHLLRQGLGEGHQGQSAGRRKEHPQSQGHPVEFLPCQLRTDGLGSTPGKEGATQLRQDEETSQETKGPEDPLELQPGQGLQDEGIGQQSQEGAGVAPGE